MYIKLRRSRKQGFDQNVKICIQGQIEHHENDAISVDMIVEELQQESFNSALLYK